MNGPSNPLARWLLSRAYGQGGTVALPSARSADSFPFIGDFPAGVTDILHRLVDQYAACTNSDVAEEAVEWCFLVGGPGNGKSEALRTLAGALKVDLPTKEVGKPAPRTVPSTWPSHGAPVVEGLEIAFINDASIPRADASTQITRASLFLDIQDGLRTLMGENPPIALFGNVNRGILLEEKAVINRIDPSCLGDMGRLAAQAIRWLAAPPAEPGSSEELATVVPIDPTKPYYGQFRLMTSRVGARRDVLVHVAFLDTLSLLEPAPGGKHALDFAKNIPTVASYQPFGGFSDRGASRDQTIAGKLAYALCTPTYWEQGGCINTHDRTLCFAQDLCPFVQNAKWLRTRELLCRFLDLLRAAELAATRRLTYRDLLCQLSLAALGQPEEEWLEGMHPCSWVQQHARALRAGIKSSAVALVSHRIYTSPFSSPHAPAWRRARVAARSRDTLYGAMIDRMTPASGDDHLDAFHQAFNDIDPARDVEPWDGIRGKVLDATESLEVLGPTDHLQKEGVLRAEACSELERIIDQLLPEEIELELGGATRPAISRAQLLRKWRHTMLLRQVGMSNGQMAFKRILSAWLAEQESALRDGASLQLGRGIKALVLPETGHEEFLLAPYRPRTYSLTAEELPSNTLMVKVPLTNLQVSIIPKGDVLIAEVASQSRGRAADVVASLVIDLPVAREAILHCENSTSFSEIGASAFARIERVRASLVSRNRMKRAGVIFTDRVGKAYRLVNNPSGPAPLRAMPME